MVAGVLVHLAWVGNEFFRICWRSFVSILPVSSIREMMGSTRDADNQPRRTEMISWVFNSAKEPCAIARNCAFSLRDSLFQPSATLHGTEMAERVICDRIPNRSSPGRHAACRQAATANRIAFLQTTESS